MPSDPMDAIEQELALIHRPRVEVPTRERDDDPLERELLAEWAARYGESDEPAAWRSGLHAGLWMLLATHRLAVACFALLVVLAGACALPTSYEVPLGLSVEIRARAGSLPAEDIARYVQERAVASEVDVIVRELLLDDQLESHMQIRLWDQNLALGEIEGELRETFPSLAAAEIEEHALEGEVETFWGRRLAHVAFDVSLREDDVEEARIDLLARLQAQGFEASEVTVNVRERDDGHREVEVRIQHDLEEGEMPDLDALDGPGFHWVHDPSGAKAIEIPDVRAPNGRPLRIELRQPPGQP